jgi:tetratricopeptide (TPR) repeat protein
MYALRVLPFALAPRPPRAAPRRDVPTTPGGGRVSARARRADAHRRARARADALRDAAADARDITARRPGLVVIEEDGRMRERVDAAAARLRREANAVDERVLHEELTERRIARAVAAEDFESARVLVEERTRKEREMSPSTALAVALARRLREPNAEETATICADVVQLGDRRIVPALLRALCVVDDEHEPAAQAIEHAIWMLWQKSGNSHYDARLLDGIRAMSIVPDGLPMARDIFSEIMEAKPEFAEAHNKRATAFYLMQLYDLSIKDCDNALALNPQHFGAHSGKGLCYLALHQYQNALDSFEAALRINPRMEHVRRYRESLKTMIDRVESKRLQGGDSP